MNCPKCGAENMNGSTFCIKCGTNLKELQSNNYTEEKSMENANFKESTSPNISQPTNGNEQIEHSVNNNNKSVALNFPMFIVAFLLKPIQCFKEEEEKLKDSKTSIILALLVTIVMTIANMIKTIFATVRVANYSLSKGYTYSWQWENLKNIKWLELIGKNFLIYACIILAIALVFYLGSSVIKKQLNLIKTLSIAAISIIPAVIGSMILAPLSTIIWNPLSMVFTIVGTLYTVLILYELMNMELQLEGDIKIYFNLVCFGVLIVGGYFILMKLLTSSATSGLKNVLDLLK